MKSLYYTLFPLSRNIASKGTCENWRVSAHIHIHIVESIKAYLTKKRVFSLRLISWPLFANSAFTFLEILYFSFWKLEALFWKYRSIGSKLFRFRLITAEFRKLTIRREKGIISMKKRSSISNKYFRNEYKMETNEMHETVLKSSLKIGKGVSFEKLS